MYYSHFHRPLSSARVRGGAVGGGTVLQTGRSRVRFPMASLEFFFDIILPYMGPPAGTRTGRGK